MQDIAIVTMEGEWELVRDLSNGAISNDLERTLTLLSTTPNLVFKVALFFDTEYLTNGYRYGQSCYRMQIGNCTQAFEWYQFQ